MNLEKIVEAVEAISESEEWGHLEGEFFGRGSANPFKALVKPRKNELWEKVRSDAHSAYLRKVNGKEKERQIERSKDIHAFDADRIFYAHRALITRTGAFVRVCWSGPAFGSIEDAKEWIDGKPVNFGGEDHPVPPGVTESSFEIDGGVYVLPVDFVPPQSWDLDRSQVKALAETSYDFAQALTAVRGKLAGEEEESESESD